MKHYWRAKSLGCAFLISFVVLGYAAIPLPGNEVFPFYSWSMFSLVPGGEPAYSVMIVGDARGRLPEPIPFLQAHGYVEAAGSVAAYRLMQDLGSAVARGEQAQAQRLREVFERNHLRPGVRYQLHRVRVDPLNQWHGEDARGVVLIEWERP